MKNRTVATVEVENAGGIRHESKVSGKYAHCTVQLGIIFGF